MQSLPTSAMVVRIKSDEVDEMGRFVQSKKQQRWLWHAIAHQTGAVLAYVLAPHEDAALKQLQQLLAPFSIGQFYTDSWGAYLRLLDSQQHTVGFANTRRIERKHLTRSYSNQTISQKNNLLLARPLGCTMLSLDCSLTVMNLVERCERYSTGLEHYPPSF